MKRSLLFIPDISGFTNFVQTTEVEHSEHVIAELLEVLINANTQHMKLAEVEGDALFFYKENHIPSQEKLLAQVESMYTAFYSHLKMMETNRICPCNACATAKNLELKIVAHCAELQYLTVQDKKKPFGEAVIQVHRLLKNSVDSNNYVLFSKQLAEEIGLTQDYRSHLFRFRESEDTYDGKIVSYLYSTIDVGKLKLLNFTAPILFNVNRPANFVREVQFEVNMFEVYEMLTSYRNRHLWVKGVDEFQFNENEVTRAGTEHTCVINGKHFDFVTITKDAPVEQLVYGEMTYSAPPVDTLYQFYTLKPKGKNNCELKLEVYWQTRTPVQKLLMLLGAGKQLLKGLNASIDNLMRILNSKSELVVV